MKAKLIINNKSLELGHRELIEISYVLDDCKEAKDIFHELAKSTATDVRSHIGSYQNLHDKTVKMLLSDTQIEVMRAVISKRKFIRLMDKEDVKRFITNGDSEVLTIMANNMDHFIEEYSVCEQDWLCEQLYRAKDPQVRYELAASEETPEIFLKKLVDDPDSNVSQAAKETLDKIKDIKFDYDEDSDDDFYD